MKTYVQQFEEWTCKQFNVKYAVALNSGTSALHVALMALGVGKGDEVIVPALSPTMPAFAVVYCGATPVFADIDTETFNISQEDAYEKTTSKTAAIIAVNLYGLPADIDKLCYKAVIEDSAESIGTRYNGEFVGTRGDMGIFSFEKSKHLSIGEGGMLVTDNDILATSARKFGGLGYKNLTASQPIRNSDPSTFQDPDYKRHDTVGYNYRMAEPCAFIGFEKSIGLADLVETRVKIAELYRDAIKEFDWLVPQSGFENNSFFTYAFRLDRDDIKWIDFYNKFKEVSHGETFYAAWSIPYQEPALSMYKGNCPIAEKYQKQMIQMKTNYKDLDEAQRLADCLMLTGRFFA